jgi:hypothetical protein
MEAENAEGEGGSGEIDETMIVVRGVNLLAVPHWVLILLASG